MRTYVVVVLSVIATTLSACGAPAPSPIPVPTPPPTPASLRAGEVLPIEVTFDGDRCVYEGPGEIAEGHVFIILNNPTNHQDIHLHIHKIEEGKTLQDAIAYLGGPYTRNEYLPAPHWVGDQLPPAAVFTVSQGGRIDERVYKLDPGNYWIVCAANRGDPSGFWHAAFFEVRPDSAE